MADGKTALHRAKKLPGMFWLLKNSASPPYARLFWGVFIYASTAAVFVQFVALPHMFSSWHAGNGLLAGMDSVAYHAQAVELAERIRTEGWSVWEITPRGHFSVGISAAVYALTVPQPWVVIPFNAASHALSAVVLLHIFLLVSRNWRWCVVATLPFVFFPSAMIWYTQLLKDGYFFTGALLFIYGWMILARRTTWDGSWRKPACAVAWILFGYVIMGLIRSFSLSLMSLVVGPILSILLIAVAIYTIRRELTVHRAVFAAAIGIACWAVLFGIKEYTVTSGIANEIAVERPASKMLTEQWESGQQLSAPGAVADAWWGADLARSIMPFVVVRLVSLAHVRDGFGHADPAARSMIDQDVEFHAPRDVAGYVARALQIAFLSPFPSQWFGEGKYESTTFMRRISMFEMLVIYLALAFLTFFLWRCRACGEVWILVTFCTSIMLIYAIAIPNVGTLYRLRYGYLMPLVGLGILGGLMAWESLRRGRHFMRFPRGSEAD